MIPGIYGDQTELLGFRAELSDQIPIEIIELQSLEEPLPELLDIKAIGSMVAHEICQRNAEGALRLAGYSFGGSVAFEAAGLLIKLGRSVCFLGMIDVVKPGREAYHPQRSEPGRHFFRSVTAKMRANLRGDLSTLAYRLLRELVGRICSSDLSLRCVLSVVGHLCPSRTRFFRRMLLFHIRRRAMDRWQPSPIRGSVFLAISQENMPSMERLVSLCPDAHVVRLLGGHAQVFQSPSFELLVSEFGKAIRESSSAPLSLD